jgi:hypothetical protein
MIETILAFVLAQSLWLLISVLIGLLLLSFVGLVIFAHLPFKVIEILNSTNVPDYVKNAGRDQFWRSSRIAILTLPLDLLSPIVVPFLLLFTKWGDDKLRLFDSIWGNDISINGDQRDENGLIPISLDPSDEYSIALCYWAEGHHPRSFYARWIWLGIRNRASSISERFGQEVVRGIGPESQYEQWVSDPDHFDGWNLKKLPGQTTWIVRKVVNSRGEPVVSLFAYSPSIRGRHRRMYFGSKIPLTIPEWDRSLVASVGWSLR